MLITLYLSMIDSDEDQLKFLQIYDKYHRLMFYVANDILQNDHIAEEAVQEAFIWVARHIHKIGEVASPQTKRFVVVITEHISFRIKKKEARHEDAKVIEFTDTYVGHSPDSTFEILNHKEIIIQIRRLPPIYKDVLYLYGVCECTTPEIADLLGISVETVKKRLQRGRALLDKKTGGIYNEC